MNSTPLRLGIAAVVVALALVIGINLLSRPSVGPPPEATPSPSAAASVTALAIRVGDPLSAGTYAIADFPVGITLEVPANWRVCSESIHEQAVCYWPTEADSAGQLAFLIVENVAADPCVPNGPLLDPPVGPSVDDLVTAISNLPGFVATAPVDVTMDGFAGKEFTLTAPTDPACEGFGTWATKYRTTGMGPGEVNTVRILDVGGVRVVMALSNNPLELAAFQRVIDSVQIVP